MTADDSGVAATIELRAGGGTGTVVEVGAGLLARPPEAIRRSLTGSAVFAVAGGRPLELYRGRLAALEASAGRWRVLEVPDGEEAKSLAVAERLWRRILGDGGKRDSWVLGFGGGTVGDLAGFVAAAFLRGVRCGLIPTTLLAQVDAAVGGKTAVNLPEAKNSVGLFSHPRWVICDVAVLATLPPAELRSGLLEVVKMGAVCDAGLLELVEGSLGRLLAAEPAALARTVVAAVRAKASVVEADPLEGDRRRILNFGHTLGHVLEAVLGYRGLRHGEAVGYGMLFALGLAADRGLPAAEAERLRRLIAHIGLPPLPALDTAAVLERLGRDKKARESGLAWIYPLRLGEATIDSEVPDAEIEQRLTAFLADPGVGGGAEKITPGGGGVR